MIGGQTYPSRALDPEDRAQCCNPIANPSGWTPLFIRGASYDLGGVDVGNFVARDLDGDGKLDLAFCYGRSSGSGPAIGVYLGSATGTFRGPILSPVQRDCSGMTSASFKHDGTIDLVLGYNSAGTIAVFSPQGGGRYGAEADFDTLGPVSCVAEGDLNGDGWPDIVYGQFLGQLGVLFNLASGDGRLGNRLDLPSQFNYAYNLAVGDFDGDGLEDIASTGQPGSAGLAIFMGVGGGVFGAPLLDSAVPNPWQIAAGKLAGGGIFDLAMSTEFQGSAYVAGTNLGGFDNPTAYPSNVTTGVLLISDMDGDGNPDIVQASGTTLVILFNRGDGTFWPAVTINPIGMAGVKGVAIADLNNDGAMDVAAIPQNGPWTIFLNGCP